MARWRSWYLARLIILRSVVRVHPSLQKPDIKCAIETPVVLQALFQNS